MALAGKILSIVGAVMVFVGAVDQWRTTTPDVGGGNAYTDFNAENRGRKRRAVWPAVGAALVVVGTALAF